MHFDDSFGGLSAEFNRFTRKSVDSGVGFFGLFFSRIHLDEPSENKFFDRSLHKMALDQDCKLIKYTADLSLGQAWVFGKITNDVLFMVDE